MANLIVFRNGSMLIETSANEPDERLKAFIDALIVLIYRRIPQWLTFEFGHCFGRRGVIYREFLCPSGSVDLRLNFYAAKNNLARALIIRGTRENRPICFEIRAGVETEFNCDELRPISIPKPKP